MQPSAVREKVYLAGWSPKFRPGHPVVSAAEDTLDELRELVASAGGETVGATVQHAAEPDPATLVGRGKAEAIRASARASGADCVVFSHDLTPTQLRNLEDTVGLKVIDRTQLILDIFARRARSREGKLQVELAQLTYLLPRLTGRGTLLSRLGGGIGTRGPGEQKLESDRRRVRTRIQRLKEAIERVRSQRYLHRLHRQEREFLTVALVGYTNAGKSTLFNTLTGAGTVTSPRMFATLDPAVRALPLQSHRKAVLTDTVGFIRHLPAHLIAAFRATFEELDCASLLLHVTDASHPENADHDEAVEELLEAIGLASTPRLHVWNKIDIVPPSAMRRIPTGPRDASVSAREAIGIQELLRQIDQALDADPLVEVSLELSPLDGEGLALLYRSAAVLSTRLIDHRVLVKARVPQSARERLIAAVSKG